MSPDDAWNLLLFAAIVLPPIVLGTTMFVRHRAHTRRLAESSEALASELGLAVVEVGYQIGGRMGSLPVFVRWTARAGLTLHGARLVTVCAVQLEPPLGLRLVLSTPRRAGGLTDGTLRVDGAAIHHGARDPTVGRALAERLAHAMHAEATQARTYAVEVDDVSVQILLGDHVFDPALLRATIDRAAALAAVVRGEVAEGAPARQAC